MRRQEPHSLQVEPKTIDWFHADGGVFSRIVFVFDPTGEGAVERFETAQVELSSEKRQPDGAKEAFHFAFGGAVAHGGMTEHTAETPADLAELFGRVDRAVVDIEALGNAPLVECVLECREQRVCILGREELAVAADPTGVINERDELRLKHLPSMRNVGSTHCVAR